MLRLGSFGFVSLSLARRDICVTLYGIRGCGGFLLLRIGFVLHNKGSDIVARQAKWEVWEGDSGYWMADTGLSGVWGWGLNSS